MLYLFAGVKTSIFRRRSEHSKKINTISYLFTHLPTDTKYGILKGPEKMALFNLSIESPGKGNPPVTIMYNRTPRLQISA